MVESDCIVPEYISSKDTLTCTTAETGCDIIEDNTNYIPYKAKPITETTKHIDLINVTPENYLKLSSPDERYLTYSCDGSASDDSYNQSTKNISKMSFQSFTTNKFAYINSPSHQIRTSTPPPITKKNTNFNSIQINNIYKDTKKNIHNENKIYDEKKIYNENNDIINEKMEEEIIPENSLCIYNNNHDERLEISSTKNENLYTRIKPIETENTGDEGPFWEMQYFASHSDSIDIITHGFAEDDVSDIIMPSRQRLLQHMATMNNIDKTQRADQYSSTDCFQTFDTCNDLPFCPGMCCASIPTEVHPPICPSTRCTVSATSSNAYIEYGFPEIDIQTPSDEKSDLSIPLEIKNYSEEKNGRRILPRTLAAGDEKIMENIFQSAPHKKRTRTRTRKDTTLVHTKKNIIKKNSKHNNDHHKFSMCTQVTERGAIHLPQPQPWNESDENQATLLTDTVMRLAKYLPPVGQRPVGQSRALDQHHPINNVWKDNKSNNGMVAWRCRFLIAHNRLSKTYSLKYCGGDETAMRICVRCKLLTATPEERRKLVSELVTQVRKRSDALLVAGHTSVLQDLNVADNIYDFAIQYPTLSASNSALAARTWLLEQNCKNDNNNIF